MPRRSTVVPRALTESEQALLEACYKQHAHALLQYAYYLTRNAEHAQDLVADTYLHIAERINFYNPQRDFLPFAKRVMRNLYIDQRRKRRVVVILSLEE